MQLSFLDIHRAYGTRVMGVVDWVNGLKPVAIRWFEPMALVNAQ